MDQPAEPTLKSVKRYIVDLDAPPEERWDQIISDYNDKWKDIETLLKAAIKSGIGATLGPAIESTLRYIMSSANKMSVYYGAELQAISKKSGLDLGRLVLLQLVYEASTACTSVVTIDKDGIPHHIRTMDWDMSFMQLDPFTIEVDFRKAGKTCFYASTWAGYVGVLTGMKPGHWSVSVNFRATQTGSFWTNVKGALSGSWPIGFLVRDTLEDQISFSDAEYRLAHSPLIAPCYFTMAGSAILQGSQLTRSVDTVLQPLKISDQREFLVQANMDHWTEDPNQDIMDSRDRRDLAAKFLRKKPHHHKSCQRALWEIMSLDPINNSITIYGTYMCPTTGVYQTLLPEGNQGFLGRHNFTPDDFSLRVPVSAGYDGKDSTSRTIPSAVWTCKNCNENFDHSGEIAGCQHTKPWHAVFGDCNYAKCAFGLGASNIGNQHWGCCFVTDGTQLTCPNRKHSLVRA